MNSPTAYAPAVAAPAGAPVEPEPAHVEARWSLATRVLFRFAFAYFGLYVLPFPIDLLHWPGSDYVIPPVRWYMEAGHKVVPWFGKHVLHLASDITVFPNGSGDTTYNWVSTLMGLIAAAAIALIWTALDRKRLQYTRLHGWFQILVRMWLGSVLVSYGAFKLFPSQFPPPYLARYFERYGDSSPMGILWTLMGASQGYSFFSGAVETLAGVLLFVPATALLGALIGAAAMLNVFALNMGFDVPVKLYSFHLMMAGIMIAAPDLPRLCNFLMRGRAIEPRADAPLVSRRWARRTLLGAQLVIGAYLLALLLFSSHRQSRMIAEFGRKTPNYGAWAVDEFMLDGAARPPLTTDPERWQNFIVQGPTGAVIVPMNGTLDRCQAKLDEAHNAIEITSSQPKWSAKLTYRREGDKLTFEGTRDGKPVKIALHRIDPQWLLKTRGFHWVNEFPFNR